MTIKVSSLDLEELFWESPNLGDHEWELFMAGVVRRHGVTYILD